MDLKEMRMRVPVMECPKDCHDCCGPVPLAPAEAARLPMKRRKKDLLTCRFLDSRGCTVYDERPMMCRLFGCSADAMLRCPRGLKPTRLLTIEETDRIMKAYLDLTGPVTRAEVT